MRETFSFSFKKKIYRFLAGLTLSYVVVMGGMIFFQEKLIFHPSTLDADYQFNFPAPVEENFTDLAGEKIHSLYFRSSPGAGVILYFHGNAGSLREWGYVAESLRQRTGLGVWIVDYPGFGKSEGRIRSESQLHNVGLRSFEAARAALVQGQKLVIYGRSIGSGIAVKLAAENQCDGLILESPFYSLKSLASLYFPWIPSFLLKYHFRSDELMPSVNCPVLIVHGDGDTIIPFSEGVRLAQLAKNITLAPVSGAGHNDLSNFRSYWDALTTFLEK